MVQHDVASPRPYSRINLISGTKGVLMDYPLRIVFDEKGKTVKEWKAGGVAMVDGTPVSTTNPTDGLDVLHMSKFVSCIRAKDPVTNVDAEQGVKSSVLPLLANIALDEGETIHLDPKTGKLKSKAGLKGWAREYAKGWELV